MAKTKKQKEFERFQQSHRRLDIPHAGGSRTSVAATPSGVQVSTSPITTPASEPASKKRRMATEPTASTPALLTTSAPDPHMHSKPADVNKDTTTNDNSNIEGEVKEGKDHKSNSKPYVSRKSLILVFLPDELTCCCRV